MTLAMSTSLSPIASSVRRQPQSNQSQMHQQRTMQNISEKDALYSTLQELAVGAKPNNIYSEPQRHHFRHQQLYKQKENIPQISLNSDLSSASSTTSSVHSFDSRSTLTNNDLNDNLIMNRLRKSLEQKEEFLRRPSQPFVFNVQPQIHHVIRSSIYLWITSWLFLLF